MTSLPGWLATPALDELWRRAATALEQRHLSPAGKIRLTTLGRESRRALAPLLEREQVGPNVLVDLQHLDQTLRERSGVGGLRATCELALGRELSDRAAARSATARKREAPFTAARASLPTVKTP